MRVVLDTNVLVSAILGGTSYHILDLWRDGKFDLLVTVDVLQEYLGVLKRPKFKLPPEVIASIGAFLYRKGIFVTPEEKILAVTDDPKDNKFLEAAIAGDADVLVSGDHHLLTLNAFRRVQILSVNQFLEGLV
jgi:putative PIN family toxin of toxin-antitoxin system